MAVAAQSVGIAGLVTDGSVRDSDQMFNLGFPVFCGGVIRSIVDDDDAFRGIDGYLLSGLQHLE